MKYFCSSLLLIIGLSNITAQSLQDALRYSLSQYSSTARSIGAGGSMSSLGADLSVANVNPAGIAEFRKSEITLSLGLPTASTESTIVSTTETEKSSSLKMNNLAVVFTHNPISSKIKTTNIAIGINKLADFNQNIFYGGASNGTRVERFLELANQRTLGELDDFEAGLAFDTELILDSDNNTIYESDFSNLDASLYREESIVRTGAMNELFFTLASNYDDKISFGATLGFPIINYSESKSYLEEDDLAIVNNFFDFIFTQDLRTTGGGINLKAGIIYKLNKKVRLSAAVHSPTWLFLSDEFSTSLDFRLDGEETGLISQSPIGTFEYSLRTPWRALGGLGFIYDLGGLKGFLNGEIEYVDYSSSSFGITDETSTPEDQFAEDDLNNEISTVLNSAINLRVGTEIAVSKMRLRAGIALMGDPTQLYNFDPQYNVGIGYRSNKIYLDLAYSLGKFRNQYAPYRLSDPQFEQVIFNEISSSRLSFTIGTKI